MTLNDDYEADDWSWISDVLGCHLASIFDGIICRLDAVDHFFLIGIF